LLQQMGEEGLNSNFHYKGEQTMLPNYKTLSVCTLLMCCAMYVAI